MFGLTPDECMRMAWQAELEDMFLQAKREGGIVDITGTSLVTAILLELTGICACTLWQHLTRCPAHTLPCRRSTI